MGNLPLDRVPIEAPNANGGGGIGCRTDRRLPLRTRRERLCERNVAMRGCPMRQEKVMVTVTEIDWPWVMLMDGVTVVLVK
jgi:hypothetical protein